jgi:transcriptional regulator with XRE-family HTH domain
LGVHIGKKIKTLRAEKGWSLPDLAEKADVSKGFLFQIESEEAKANPSLETLNKIARALGITLANLLEKESIQARQIVPEEVNLGLKEFIKERHAQNLPIDEKILQALYVLQERKGQAKKTKEDWKWLYGSIEHAVKGK